MTTIRERPARLLPVLALLAAACGGADDPAPVPDARAGSPSAIRFVERGAEAGLEFHMSFLPGEQGANFKVNLYDHGAGVAVADVDGDHDDDLYFCNQLGGNALFLNDGTGRFTDATAGAGPIALADRICVSAAFGDIDGDGDRDLYVASVRGGNALFRNDGEGRFRDVTDEAGVAWTGHTQGCTFFDADGDGDLDLYITNTAEWTTNDFDPKARYYTGVGDLIALIESRPERNAYFRNDGTGRFTEATDEAGLAGAGWGGDIAVFDYDEDGDLDVFVTNMFGDSQLYRNDGTGRFANAMEEAMGRTPWGAVGAKAFDYSGDGRLDLYVVDMHSDMWMDGDYDYSKIVETRKHDTFMGLAANERTLAAWEAAAYSEKAKIGNKRVFFGNGLYRNEGDGTFVERSDEANAETFWPWGVAAADFDADGWMDVFLASGMGYPFPYWRSPLLRNRGDGTFEDVSGGAGVDPPPGGETLGFRIVDREATRSSRSAAVGDFDADGRPDLVVNNFNDRPFLYLNRSPERPWIAFRLRGTRSNRDAIGARVLLTVGDRVLVRQVHAAGGYLAQSSNTLLFGLPDGARVARCEVVWPDGFRQVLDPVPATGAVHPVTEPAR